MSNISQQQEMERVLRASAKMVAEQFAGTINGILAPGFVSCDYEKGTLTCSFPMRKEYANPNGVLHGGLTSALFDIAMGALAGYYSGNLAPTISISVSFLRPIPTDHPVFVRVHMNNCGSTICNLSAEAFTEDAPDIILSTAVGTYLVAKKD